MIEGLLLDVAELGDIVAESIDHLGLCLKEGGEEFWLLIALLDDLCYEGLVGLLKGWLVLLLALGLVGLLGGWLVMLLALDLV